MLPIRYLLFVEAFTVSCDSMRRRSCRPASSRCDGIERQSQGWTELASHRVRLMTDDMTAMTYVEARLPSAGPQQASMDHRAVR